MRLDRPLDGGGRMSGLTHDRLPSSVSAVPFAWQYLGQTFDYVITVCDQARQACPVFPGVHETLHWGYEDPAAVEGSEAERLAAFRSTLTMMATRIQSFITLARRDRLVASAG